MISEAMKSLVLLALALPVFSAPPIRVMLLDGESAGTYHAWRETTPVLKTELEQTGIFQVQVVSAPAARGDFSTFKPDFTKYDVIVSNLDSQSWPADLQAAFEQYVKNGGGFVSVHAADNGFPNWVAFNEMIGVGGWRGRREQAGPHWFLKDGRLESDPSPGSAGSHGARLPFQVTTRDAAHPVMKGLPPVWMHAGDELYANLRGPGQNMNVLATAYSDPANQGTGKDEPMLMALSYGNGRIFHTTMGHDIPALSCVGFIVTLQRGTEWAATGKVTQKVPADFPSADKVVTREVAAK